MNDALPWYPVKIKSIAMQKIRIVQAVALMLIVALAASCAATKEYASRIFPTKIEEKDSQAVALRFLELDKLEPVADVPVARNYNNGEIREKKTREDNP